jgi:hypothetical protein
MLDDFFVDKPKSGGEAAALSLDKLREFRGRLAAGGRRLDLWAVLYEHQLDPTLAPFLKLLDVVSLWAWNAEKVRNMSESLRQLEALAPSCGKVLGCYMWDYGRKSPMPLDVLKDLYGLGLDWLRQGRIEGMIFLASCICDLELEAVEWTREWVAKIGVESI